MKKIVITFVLAALLVVVASCTKKRCVCMTVRTGYDTTYGLEPMGSHKNCTEFDKEWIAVEDSTSDMLTMTCIPEE